MSYTNQLTTNLADLINKLQTFLGGAPAWTIHHVPANGEFAARKTGVGPDGKPFDIGFASQWDTATPDYLGIYQWHGAAYNPAFSPWDQNDDSGNGQASTNPDQNGRSCYIGNTPVQFWCFEDDHYFHVAVEYQDGRFSHFGAGLLDKFNDWDGGEYVYGWWQDQIFSGDQATIGNSTILLDGLSVDTSPGFLNMEERVATLHVENLPLQNAGGKYAVVMGAQNKLNLGQDRQGPAGGPKTPVDRISFVGGYRAGPFMYPFAEGLRGTKTKGNCPMHPIVQCYNERVDQNIYGPMSQMKDVRGVNIRDFDAGEELTLGADVWVMFPSARKALSDAQSGVAYSLYQGIAYKKVTT